MAVPTEKPDEMSPALRDAYYLLRDRMLSSIDTMECVLEQCDDYDDEVVLAVAHNEMPRLVLALRGLLKDHAHDENGRCRSCGYRKTEDGYELRAWPCPVVTSVHSYVEDAKRFYDYLGKPDPIYA